MMRHGGRGSLDPRKLAGYGFVAGMVAAPFLALVYGWNAGLGVMALALAATTYLVLDASRTADDDQKRRLQPLLITNAVLTLVCVVILVLRLV